MAWTKWGGVPSKKWCHVGIVAPALPAHTPHRTLMALAFVALHTVHNTLDGEPPKYQVAAPQSVNVCSNARCGDDSQPAHRRTTHKRHNNTRLLAHYCADKESNTASTVKRQRIV